MKKDVKVATTEKSIDISLKYKKVFGTSEGKVVLMDFIKRCGLLSCPNTSDEKDTLTLNRHNNINIIDADILSRKIFEDEKLLASVFEHFWNGIFIFLIVLQLILRFA